MDPQPEATGQPLSSDEIGLIHAWWRAANYLSVGQIYLLDNPLLREPLKMDHVKPRLLGHWGTTPGLNFLYVHLNRVINTRNVDGKGQRAVAHNDSRHRNGKFDVSVIKFAHVCLTPQM